MSVSRRETILLLATASMFWFSIYIFSPIVPMYAEDLGATARMIGIIGGSYGLMQVLFRVPIGIVSDKIGLKKPFVIAGISFAVIANIIPLLFPSIPGLLVSRTFSGLVSACWVAMTVLAVTRSSLDPARAMARLSVFTYLGQIPANLLSGWLSRAYGYSAPYLFGVLTSAIALCLCFFIKEEKRPRTAVSVPGLLRVGLIPRLLLISLVGLIYQFASFATTSNFTPIMMKNLGASSNMVGIMTAVNTTCVMIGALLVSTGRLRRFRDGVLVVSGMLTVAACVFLMPFGTSPAAILALQGVMGLGGGLCFPVLTSMSITCVPPEKGGAATGFYQSIYALGIFLGPILNGVLADAFSLATGYYGVAVLTLGGAVLATRLIGPKKMAAAFAGRDTA